MRTRTKERTRTKRQGGKQPRRKALTPPLNRKHQSGGGYTDLGWMFAAYVNENSPIVDKILKEALATKIVDSFAGYQKGPDDAMKELLAVWTALQNAGSSTATSRRPRAGRRRSTASTCDLSMSRWPTSRRIA